MAVDDGALAEALGARRPDVVLPDHLEELRARQARDRGADVVRLRERGPDELLEVLERARRERHELERREPAEEPNEQVEDEDAGEEDRQRESADRQHAHDVVDPRVLVHGGHDDERHGPEHRDEDRRSASSSERGTRSFRISATGRFCEYDCPKSARNASPSQATYCTTTGRSSPSSARSCRTCLCWTALDSLPVW